MTNTERRICCLYCDKDMVATKITVRAENMDGLKCPGCGFQTVRGEDMAEYMRLAGMRKDGDDD